MMTTYLMVLLVVAVVAAVVLAVPVSVQRSRLRLARVRREPTAAERLEALRRAREDAE